MKKTIIAIALVAVLATVLATAYRYGYSPYGVVYYDSPYYSYYQYYEPYQHYYRPAYAYPSYASNWYYPQYQSPLSSSYMYRYGYYSAPEVSYPTAVTESPRGGVGQLCGVSEGQAFGCVSGLVCDYSKVAQSGIGLCSRRSVVSTY